MVFINLFPYLHSFFAAAIPPSQRVHFILGEEADGDDGTHESHPLFSEMEELCFNHDAGEAEWNETARSVYTNIVYKYKHNIYSIYNYIQHCSIFYQHKHKALVYIHHKDDDV